MGWLVDGIMLVVGGITALLVVTKIWKMISLKAMIIQDAINLKRMFSSALSKIETARIYAMIAAEKIKNSLSVKSMALHIKSIAIKLKSIIMDKVATVQILALMAADKARIVAMGISTAATWVATAAATAFGFALNLGLGPILLIVAGLAALAAGAYLLYKHWDKVTVALSQGWKWVKGLAVAFGDWLDSLGPVGKAVRKIGTAVFNMLILPFKILYQFISGVFKKGFSAAISDVWNTIRDTFGDILDIIIWPFKTGYQFISNMFSGESFSKVFSGLWNTISDTFGNILNILIFPFKAGYQFISNMFSGESFSKIFSNVWNTINDTFGNILDIIIWPFKAGYQFISGIFTKGFSTAVSGVRNTISDTFRGILNIIIFPFKAGYQFISGVFTKGFSAAISDLYNTVKNTFGGIFKIITWPFRAGYQLISGIFSGESFSKIFSGLWDSLLTTIMPIREFFISVFEPIGNFVGTVIDGIVTKFQIMWESITGLFGGIKDFFVDKFKGIAMWFGGFILKILDKVPDFLLPKGLEEYRDNLRTQIDTFKAQEESIKDTQKVKTPAQSNVIEKYMTTPYSDLGPNIVPPTVLGPNTIPSTVSPSTVLSTVSPSQVAIVPEKPIKPERMESVGASVVSTVQSVSVPSDINAHDPEAKGQREVTNQLLAELVNSISGRRSGKSVRGKMQRPEIRSSGATDYLADFGM